MSEKPLFEDIKKILIEQNREPSEIEEIEKAYLFAKRLHEGQYRVSEEPYIIHPVEVAKILVGLKVDSHTLEAAFLHDILEDTETQPEEIEKLFGKDVLTLVQGVTKLGKLQFKSKEERQAENFRRLFIAMASDIRIVFLKLADRLHNMRTLNFMTTAKQQKIARETLDPRPSDYSGKSTECKAYQTALEKNLEIIKKCNFAYYDNCTVAYKGKDTLYKKQYPNKSDNDILIATAGWSALRENRLKAAPAAVLSNGSVILYYTYPLEILIDVNGKRGPNKWGYDLFWVQLKGSPQKGLFYMPLDSIVENGGVTATQALLK